MIGAAAGVSELEFGASTCSTRWACETSCGGTIRRGAATLGRHPLLSARQIANLATCDLHRGQWNGQQIVPVDWVAMSTTPPPGERSEPGGVGVEWRPARRRRPPIRRNRTRRANPHCLARLDVVVVITAGGNAGQLAQLIRQSVTSERQLPANPAAHAELRHATAAAAGLPSRTRSEIPAMAATISGRVYQFPVNPSRIDSFALTFDRDGTARVDVKYYGEP